MLFHIAMHKDPGSTYGVTVPDLPGCFSSGKTMDQALASAKEAITGHIETLLELGDAVNVESSPLEVHVANPEFAGAIWAVVDIDLAELDSAPSRFNVSMPRFVLSRIDRYAEAKHETRSGFLARAALEAITRENEAHALEAVL